MKKYLFSYRTFGLLLFLLLTICWTISASKVELPRRGEFPKLYSNQCEDDLRKVYLEALDRAEKSIVLIIYSMTDRYILERLQKKAEEGIKVIVVHDHKTKQYGFNSLGKKIIRYAKKGGGIMHQKILIIDEREVYIGSTNLTSSSLRVYDNLIMGCSSRKLARAILGRHDYLELAPSNSEHEFLIGKQRIEFWSFPEEGKAGLNYLIDCLDNARSTLKVAMFTWTHPLLTAAVIRAKDRGINVEIVIDRNQGMGVSKKSVETLAFAKVPIFFSKSELCHHKMAIIDDSLLILGSANWTNSAFTRNNDCFIVIHKLTKKQSDKLKMLWKVVRCTREPIVLSEEKIQLAEAA